jgi:hypothetical protein
VDGTYFFFKTPKTSAVKSVRLLDTKTRVRFTEDSNYIYLISDQSVEVLYTNGRYESAKPVELFLNSANELTNRYYVDGRVYSFNAVGLKIAPNGKVTRARLDGNIIHLDSFIIGTEKLLYSQKDILNEIIDKPKFSSSQLKSYIKMDNESEMAPFIYPKNVFTIDDETVFVKVYIEDGLIKKEMFNIDGLVILSESTVNSVFVFGIKIKNSNSKIAAAINNAKTIEQPSYAGTERLSVQHNPSVGLWQNQTMILGTRSGQMVQFNLGTDIGVYDESFLSVVDMNGANILGATIVGDTIFVKSEVSVGVKYKSREPGIFV